MLTATFPPDTKAPMPSFWRRGGWVKAWRKTKDDCYVVRDGEVSDFEAWAWATMLNIVAEEGDGEAVPQAED